MRTRAELPRSNYDVTIGLRSVKILSVSSPNPAPSASPCSGVEADLHADYLISKIASISTATPVGSETNPTALRAW